jgi:hypothetical protein
MKNLVRVLAMLVLIVFASVLEMVLLFAIPLVLGWAFS